MGVSGSHGLLLAINDLYHRFLGATDYEWPEAVSSSFRYIHIHVSMSAFVLPDNKTGSRSHKNKEPECNYIICSSF